MKKVRLLIVVLGIFLLGQEAFSEHTVFHQKLVIQEIICRGNHSTDCDLITKKFYQKKGDTLRFNEVEEAKLRIGTSRLYKDISVTLEKGNQRNHVIVVFNVEEAKSRQHQINISYQGKHGLQDFCIQQIECLDFVPEHAIRTSYIYSDYDFLNSGKILSVGLRSYNALGYELRSLSGSLSTIEIEKDIYSFVYDYHDPHLFGLQRLFVDLYGAVNAESGHGSVVGTLGFRFANFSYFRLGKIADSNGESINAIAYGWDSRDRDLYPTSGSQFEIGLPLIGYTAFHSINDDNLLSYRIGVTDNDLDNGEEYNSLLEVKYTRLFEFNETTGTYSGLSLSLGYFDGYVLGAQYRHQTDDIVFNFNLSVEILGGEQ